MSDTATPITPAMALKRSFTIGVPAGQVLTTEAAGDPAPIHTDTYANYLRIGGVNEDERNLQQDPNATATPALLGTDYAYAFADGTLTYSLGTMQFAAPQAYVRLGPPSQYELWLATDPLNPTAPVPPADLATTLASTGAFKAKGLLLHSTDTCQIFAPSLVQTAKTITTTSESVSDWSGTSLTATYVGKMVASCTYIDKDITSVLSNCTVQTADNFTSTMGSLAASVIGNNTMVWAGNDTSTGVGSLLWSNYGTTQNVFGGQVVNVTNGNIDVQGWGEAKVSDLVWVAPETIQLSIGGTAAMTTLAVTIQTALKRLNIAAGILLTAATVLPQVQVDVQTAFNTSETDIADAMEIYKTEMRGLIVLVAVIQLMAIVAGKVTQKAVGLAAAASAASITVASGSITLSAGGTTVTIGNAGFKVDAGNPAYIAKAVAAQALVEANNAVSDVMLAGYYEDPWIQDADDDQELLAAAGGAVAAPMGPPAIVFSSLLVKTSALRVETNMYN